MVWPIEIIFQPNFLLAKMPETTEDLTSQQDVEPLMHRSARPCMWAYDASLRSTSVLHGRRYSFHCNDKGIFYCRFVWLLVITCMVT